MVHRDHRNRGLGRWLKAEMWRQLREQRPDVRTLDTGNAESNDAMLAINEAMGFKPHARLGIWQGSIESVLDKAEQKAAGAAAASK